MAADELVAIVVGGWHSETWAPTDAVFVYDFLMGAWRRGAPMPGPCRSFTCAAVGSAVYVAGGHDDEKNALRSALAYDPEADAWAQLPDMAEERDEPSGVCVAGRFVVGGGYPTQAQGWFVGSAEAGRGDGRVAGERRREAGEVGKGKRAEEGGGERPGGDSMLTVRSVLLHEARPCASSSRAPRKRTLPAFPWSQTEGALLHAHGRATERPRLRKHESCSLGAQPSRRAGVANTPLAPVQPTRRSNASSSSSLLTSPRK